MPHLKLTSKAQISWKVTLKQTHKSVGKTACRGSGLTFEVFGLPLLLSELMDSCSEEMDSLQLLANGSIFCQRDGERDAG